MKIIRQVPTRSFATRESLSERLDTAFAGRKQIDDELLDKLEKKLIAADSASQQHEILETVRRGVARKQINDLDALKQAIKQELLNILRASGTKESLQKRLFRRALLHT